MDTQTLIRHFILSRFMIGQKDSLLKDDASFLEQGILDSTGVLELVAFIEETFKFKIQDEELVPENLDSVRQLVRFIQAKQSHVA